MLKIVRWIYQNGLSSHLKSNNLYEANCFINGHELMMAKININTFISKEIRKRLEGAYTTHPHL